VADLIEASEEYLLAADKIQSAHQRAGAEIRKALLKKVKNSDLSELSKFGKMEFRLDGRVGVALTAYRIIEVSSSLYQVDSSEVGIPFDIRNSEVSESR